MPRINDTTAYPVITDWVGADKLPILRGSDGDPQEQVALSSMFSTGKTLYVDATNGVNATAIRGMFGRAFLTLAASQTAASSGDCVDVYSGTFSLTAGLGASGVNWDFAPGAIANATDCYCFDVSTGITSSVYGHGDFVSTRSASGEMGGLRVNHASAVVTFECKRLRTVGGFTAPDAAVDIHNATRVYIGAEEISASSTSYYTVYWGSGDLFVNARRIFNEGGATSVATIYSASSVAGAKMWVNADEVFHANASAFGAVHVGTNSDATSAVWMNVKELRCSASSLYACVIVAGGKFYLNSQKIFNSRTGGVAVKVSGSGCLSYITTQKIEAATAIGYSDGTSWTDVKEHNDSGFSGTGITCSGGTHFLDLKTMLRTASGVGVSVSGGTLELDGAGGILKTTSGNGVNISGGTLRMTNIRIDTSADASGYPINVTGGTLILGAGVVLVAAGSQACVNAASAQTIKNYGAVANTAKSANITVNDGSALPIVVYSGVV